MNKQDKEKLTSHIERNQLMTEVSMFGRTAEIDVVPSDRLLDLIDELASPVKAKLAKHWDEDLGDCLWWDFPVDEPPYCGTPLDDDFPKYKTHFTELYIPDEIEEEPKWVVKVDDNGYFVDFFDSLTPHLVDGLGWEVMRLDDKSKADAVALIIGGKAEKA